MMHMILWGSYIQQSIGLGLDFHHRNSQPLDIMMRDASRVQRLIYIDNDTMALIR